MNPEILYPLLAMALTAISIGGTFFFSRQNAKRGDIEILHNKLRDVEERLTKCETARETLTNDRVAILEKVALQTLSSIQNPVVVPVTVTPHSGPVDTIESPKVQVKAVK